MAESIADTRPLLHLREIGRTGTLKIFDKLLIPSLVGEELTRYGVAILVRAWRRNLLQRNDLEIAIESLISESSLHMGKPFRVYLRSLLQDPPAESRTDYIKTAKRIGDTSDHIYIKAFAKNPDKYAGQRVKVSVKVFKIEEQAGKALMNVYLSREYEPAVVYYDGETDIYDGDVIMVYGEVLGRLEGQNALGATMSWPTIHARHIEKMKYEE